MGGSGAERAFAQLEAACGQAPQATLALPDGLMRHGDDWLYDEWAVQGHVQRIGADGFVLLAQPFAAAPPSRAAAAAAVDPLQGENYGR